MRRLDKKVVMGSLVSRLVFAELLRKSAEMDSRVGAKLRGCMCGHSGNEMRKDKRTLKMQYPDNPR